MEGCSLWPIIHVQSAERIDVNSHFLRKSHTTLWESFSCYCTGLGCAGGCGEVWEAGWVGEGILGRDKWREQKRVRPTLQLNEKLWVVSVCVRVHTIYLL